ncbi:hypothetical protein [Litorihabitans aurantiacus]|uniref:PH domain-containing protein n=1 Tax=Litorihabitans aurantiacus TaxID=1930061 RepID=A0AA37UVN6_9MICO|nr:hypothetical protein [Litorihabitans aurantiacus]GMA31311.1 hypothetical protein GCM10025875_13030 [Litorihabitans aurantiacus]
MSRPVAVALLALIGLALLGLMWLGWRARARRTAGVAAPAVEPAAAPTLVVEGVYVSSTTAGEWLDRIAADGLGVRSAVRVEVAPDGVWLRRRGAPDVAIPTADLRGARRENGIAGKVPGRQGLVVIRWQRGDRALDTGIRTRYAADRDPLIAAVDAITPAPTGPDVKETA